MKQTSRFYGMTRQGQPVTQYTMENQNGLRVSFLDYGCILTELWVPDARGVPRDIVLGFDSLADYEENRDACFGALVGRCAGRIRNSEFTLHGSRYLLEANEGLNHLHGSWSRRIFRVGVTAGGFRFSYHSPDGEEGYPGAVDVTVSCTLDERNILTIKYQAVSNADTVLNLTHHNYFNLAGHSAGRVDDQLLQLAADSYLEAADDFCPTGQLLPVEGTPMDFRQMHRIGQGFPIHSEQMELVNGYDHYYVLRPDAAPAALAYAPETGITMQIMTTQPGMLFHSGNFLEDGTPPGKGGVRYEKRSGFCLEPGQCPDAAGFPGVICKRGEVYDTTVLYQFQTIGEE